MAVYTSVLTYCCITSTRLVHERCEWKSCVSVPIFSLTPRIVNSIAPAAQTHGIVNKCSNIVYIPRTSDTERPMHLSCVACAANARFAHALYSTTLQLSSTTSHICTICVICSSSTAVSPLSVIHRLNVHWPLTVALCPVFAVFFSFRQECVEISQWCIVYLIPTASLRTWTLQHFFWKLFAAFISINDVLFVHSIKNQTLHPSVIQFSIQSSIQEFNHSFTGLVEQSTGT